MGLLDDLVYNASPDNGSGLLGYLNSGRTAHVPDSDVNATNANDLATALGLNNIGTGQDASAPAAPAAPQVPISQSNFTPPAAPAPMTSPVQAPQFGANPSPYMFPQSAAFGAPLPTPAAPAVAPAVVNANAAAGDDEEDTPSAPAANAPASPIGVGGVQMPRIGPASAFTPAPDAPAAAAPSPLAVIGNRLQASLKSATSGGGLIGGVASLFDGQLHGPQAKQAAAQNLTYQALTRAGVDPQVAQAAVMPGNTEMLKSLLPVLSPAAYTQETDKDGNVFNKNKQTGQLTVAFQPKDDKFVNVETKNPDGSTTVRTLNSKTGEYGEPLGPTPGARSIDPGLTGKDRMDALMQADPNYARRVQSAVNGDIPLPTQGQAARSPAAAKFVEDVLAVDGSTSASDFNTKANTRKDYASGMASRVTKSLNTTIEHAAQLDSYVDKLGNYSYFPGIANYIHDKVGSNTDKAYQVAKSKFEETKEAFVKELDFTLSGGHSSVSGSAELRDKINRADSPEAMHAAISSALHLLSARIDSHTTGFNQGTKSQRDPQDFLYPKNRAAFNNLMGSADTSTGAPVPGVDTAPPAASAPAQPATPSLKVGQSTTINGIPIKKVAD